MKDLYIEKYQILLTEFKDDPNNERWEYICVHGLEDLILLIWQCSQIIYRFNVILSKFQLLFFFGGNWQACKVFMEVQRIQNSPQECWEKTKLEDSHFPISKFTAKSQ